RGKIVVRLTNPSSATRPARAFACNRDAMAELAASNTHSNLISSPHPREADWYVPICRPAWLHLHPAIIDDLFVQFGHLPAGRERRFRVIGQQVHVRLDCDRLAIGCLEVRRHPCRHNEKWMK